MPTHIIKSFRGGLSDEDNKGLAGAFKYGQNLNIRKQGDTLSCNQAMAKESGTTVTDLIVAFVPASDGNTYAFGNTGKIYKRTSGGSWSLEYTDSGAIKGAGEWNGYLYWATDTSLKKNALGAISTPTTVGTLNSATWHTMQPNNGSFLICNNSDVAMVGYDNSFTSQALRLTPDARAMALAEIDGYTVVGTFKPNSDNQGYFFTWEPSSQNWVRKKKIPTKGINALIETEILMAQAGQNGGIYYADLTDITPLFLLDGARCNPYGVDSREGLAYFGMFGNTKPGIYSFGRTKKNLSRVPNLEYTLSPAAIDEIGAIAWVGDTLLASWKNGATYGVDALSSTVKATAVYESLDFIVPPTFVNPQLFQTAKLLMKPLPANCSIALAYRMNKSGSFVTAKTADGSTSFSTTSATEAMFEIAEEGKVYEAQITLTPYQNTTPEVFQIETYL